MPKFISHSSHETRSLGNRFAKKLQGGSVLALHGELGSGKTTFIKGLAQGLGIRETVTSPTFVIFSPYRTGKQKIKTLYHFDLYRLQKLKNLEEFGIREILQDQQGIVAVEWPNATLALPLQETYNLEFHHRKNPKERLIAWTKK